VVGKPAVKFALPNALSELNLEPAWLSPSLPFSQKY
jgi:hypothetical protein